MAARTKSAVELMMNFIGILSSKNIDLGICAGRGARVRRDGSEGANRIKRRRIVHVVIARGNVGRLASDFGIEDLVQRTVEAVKRLARGLVPTQARTDRRTRPETGGYRSGRPIQINVHRVIVAN